MCLHVYLGFSSSEVCLGQAAAEVPGCDLSLAFFAHQKAGVFALLLGFTFFSVVFALLLGSLGFCLILVCCFFKGLKVNCTGL